VWFFDGEIVVECVVNVVKKNYIEIARKRYATFFRFIFVAIPLSGWVMAEEIGSRVREYPNLRRSAKDGPPALGRLAMFTSQHRDMGHPDVSEILDIGHLLSRM